MRTELWLSQLPVLGEGRDRL